MRHKRWSIGTAIANYVPRPGREDATLEEFSGRVNACRACRHQVAGQCGRTGQLCAVMARCGLSCPDGLWSGPHDPPAIETGAEPVTPPAPIDVVIPCHNYGHYLAECLDSVLASTVQPRSIVVVDDRSIDDTAAVAAAFADRGVRYLRVEHGSAIKSRRAGFDVTSAEYVLFLDSDDVVASRYIEAGLSAFRPAIGVVNSDFEYFGDQIGRRDLTFDGEQFWRRNTLHAGSIYRRAALDVTQAMEQVTFDSTHDDWTVGRRVVSRGWRVAKNPIPYRYRQHGGSMLSSRGPRRMEYFTCANLASEPVTIFVALSGRRFAWPRLSAWLRSQTWPRSQCELMLADCGADSDFAADVRRWLPSAGYDAFRFARYEVGQTAGLADADRHDPEILDRVRRTVARIYSRLAVELHTEYALIVEDDVIPPPDAIERLLRALDFETVAATGVYPSRYHKGLVIYDRERRPLPGGVGIEQVGGHGFGCLLVRPWALRKFPITHRGRFGDFDLNFAAAVASAGYKSVVDWSVRCEHLEGR